MCNQGQSSVAAVAATSGSFWDTTAPKLPDPTRMFSLLVMAITVCRFIATTAARQNSNSGEHDNVELEQQIQSAVVAAIWGFVLHPVVLGSLGLAVATVVAGLRQRRKKKQQQSIPTCDRWTAEWYWWNAWLYHMVMDGASGSLRLVPVVVQQYDMLDLRFIKGHVVPYAVGMIELLVMGPLCLATIYSILSNSTWRYPLELITSSLQWMGMILFVFCEVYEEQVNVPALDPVGVPGNAWANVKFNSYHFTYYWFGFWFCNFIWFFVPLYRIYRGVDECARALQIMADNKNASSKKSD